MVLSYKTYEFIDFVEFSESFFVLHYGNYPVRTVHESQKLGFAAVSVNLFSKSLLHLVRKHLTIGSDGEKDSKDLVEANYLDGAAFFFEKFDRILGQKLPFFLVFERDYVRLLSIVLENVSDVLHGLKGSFAKVYNCSSQLGQISENCVIFEVGSISLELLEVLRGFLVILDLNIGLDFYVELY